MGQCQYCRGVKDDPSSQVASDGTKLEDGYGVKHSGSDSALDSDQSGDEGSYSGVPGVLKLTRSGHSSVSSGKYSLRESFSSCGDCERHDDDFASASANVDVDDALEASVFDDLNQEASTEGINHEHLHPLQDFSAWRKLSKGSNESDRGSMTSMSSLTSELRARLGRSISLKLQRQTQGTTNGTPSSPWKEAASSPKKPRSVSLRLPRKQKRPRNFRTKLPTIYVDDTELPQDKKQKSSRKKSLRRTFSLLNVSSLARQDSQPESQQKSQKPVQKILRQPRRRHNTVRGISGMAIDGSNRTGIHSTRYYPTSTSLRLATPTNILYL